MLLLGSKRPPVGASESGAATLPAKKPPLLHPIGVVSAHAENSGGLGNAYASGLYMTTRMPYLRQQGTSSDSISRVTALYILHANDGKHCPSAIFANVAYAW